MSHKFKGVTLAFVAILAMSAFVASAAQAITFSSSSYPQTVTAAGSGIGEKFETEGGSIECEESKYHGVLSEPSSSLEMSPTYTGCTAFFGFASAFIHTNGCRFRWSGWEHDSATATYTARLSIVCPAGKVIEVTAGTCLVHIPAQSNLSILDLTNWLGAFLLKPTVKGLTYNVTKDGWGCPFAGPGHRVGGGYRSSGYIFSGGGVQIST
jgi:hypothetical protein